MEICNGSLTKEQAEAYHDWIASLYDEKLRTGGDLSSCGNEIWKKTNIISETGRLIYESFSDQELLDILRSAASRVGRIPNKSDVYCVYRSYIKIRFGCWNAALIAAGLLSKVENITNDSDYSDQETELMLDRLSEGEQLLLFKILASGELPHYYPAVQVAKKSRKAIIKILKDEFEYESLISLLRYRDNILSPSCASNEEELRQLSEYINKAAESLGRTPLRAELDEIKAFKLWRAQKGWSRAMQACGLEPLNNVQLKRAYEEYAIRSAAPYKVYPELSKEKALLLEELCNISRSLGRTMGKEDIPRELILKINKQFGSWKAVLTKMGILKMDGDDMNEKISDK